MAHKYTVGFQVDISGEKNMYIETDDIDGLSEADWFREFLAINSQASARVIQREIPSQRENDALVALENANRQISQLTDIVNQLRTERARAPAPAQVQQSSQAPQQSAPQAPRKMPSSFLEIDPNSMTAGIWNSLTTEQQNQWRAQYKIG